MKKITHTMPTKKMCIVSRILPVVVALALYSCQSTDDHGHDHGDHDHGDVPTLDRTVWTDQTELFVEFPVLVVGQTSRFAAHFTVLDGHQPVREGQVTASLIKDGKGIRQNVDAPSSPGIFKPSLQPNEAGTYQLVFELKTPGLSDHIVIQDVQVYPSLEEAKTAMGEDEGTGGAISFLKEQAWKMPFHTEPVRSGPVFDVIHTSGVWQVAPSDSRTLVANANGVVAFSGTTLTVGVEVKQGDVLLTLRSSGLTANNLASEVTKAKADYEKLKSEYERKKQLHDSGIVPTAELEAVENQYLVAKSNYETLNAGYAAGGKQVVAPFDGFIKSISVSNGDYAEQGTHLVSVTTHRAPLLQTQVSPASNLSKADINNIWYKPSNDHWSSLQATGGQVLSVGKEVDKTQPQLPVYAQVNEVIDMPEGAFTDVMIAYGQADTALVISESALLEDYGSYAVIVQLSGESFERRTVIVGRRNGELAEIKNGLAEGEVVVTEGAYQVKMASMSGQAPAHGHAH